MGQKGQVRCRHRDTWLLGASWEWCYACGALRPLAARAPNVVFADGVWQRPVGVGGENPHRPHWRWSEQDGARAVVEGVLARHVHALNQGKMIDLRRELLEALGLNLDGRRRRE